MTGDSSRRSNPKGEDLTLSDLPSSQSDEKAPSLSTSTRTRLKRSLLLKAAIEALFIFTLALSFYLNEIRAPFNGAIDSFDGRTLTGWVEEAEGQARVEVQLFIDGRFISSVNAEHHKDFNGVASESADVRAKSGPYEKESASVDVERDLSRKRLRFFFEIPVLEEGEHEASVFAAMNRDSKNLTLKRIGDVMRYQTGATRNQ